MKKFFWQAGKVISGHFLWLRYHQGIITTLGPQDEKHNTRHGFNLSIITQSGLIIRAEARRESMSENNARTFEDFTKEARERLDQAEVFINKQANELRKVIIRQLRDARQNIQERIAGRKLDAEAQAQVDKVLSRLDEMTGYLENHTVEQMGVQATQAVQQHVWRNLLFAFLIGLIIGIFISRRD